MEALWNHHVYPPARPYIKGFVLMLGFTSMMAHVMGLHKVVLGWNILHLFIRVFLVNSSDVHLLGYFVTIPLQLMASWVEVLHHEGDEPLPSVFKLMGWTALILEAIMLIDEIKRYSRAMENFLDSLLYSLLNMLSGYVALIENKERAIVLFFDIAIIFAHMLGLYTTTLVCIIVRCMLAQFTDYKYHHLGYLFTLAIHASLSLIEIMYSLGPDVVIKSQEEHIVIFIFEWVICVVEGGFFIRNWYL